MDINRKKVALLLGLFLLFSGQLLSQEGNVVIVIIDGARYTETFGDQTRQYVPFMSDIAEEGSLIEEFHNDSTTYTSRAIPALWCGTWTDVIDTVYNGSSTKYAKKPTLFEYFRKQTGSPASNCYYVLPYIENLWLPSFDPDYGPEYWPEFHSVGNSDEDVCNETTFIINNIHPQLLVVYLADVDHGGHSGNWYNYTKSIEIADSIVGVIWNTIQANPFYADNTTLIVTNDHGRHDNQHGGFQGHGCGCNGCRHIMFLAAGKGIKSNFVYNQYRRIPDMAVTACELLGIEPEKATGEVMTEILNPSSSNKYNPGQNSDPDPFIYPNPFEEVVRFNIDLSEPTSVNLTIFDLKGKEVYTLKREYRSGGKQEIIWLGKDNKEQNVKPGIYPYSLFINDRIMNGKLIKTSK